MLRLMRDYATSWLIKLLLGAIVIVFIFWGVGSFTERRAGRVALVNGQPIDVAAFNRTYSNLIEQYRGRFGNNLTDDMLQMFGVKKQALEALVNQELLLQEAQKLEFHVSEDELAAAISQIPAFQQAGSFDPRRYNAVLTQLRLSPEEFEAYQKEAMMIDRLRAFMLGNVKVSGGEVRAWYDWQNAEVNLDYVRFTPESYTDIDLAPEALEAYYDQHQDNYKTEPLVRASYLVFDFDAYQDRVSVGDDELRDYYDLHSSEFEKPETAEARHILFKLDDGASTQDAAKLEQKALEVMKLAQTGQDFAELAKQFSECPSKDQGGFLGAFTRDAMVAPFAEKVFSMKAGEISEPVRTQFGWHIIKLEKINPAAVETLDQAKAGILQKLKTERAKSLAFDDAEAAYEASTDGEDLAKLAQRLKLPLQTTGFFSRQGAEIDLKESARFADEAFELAPMAISDIQDFSDGYYLLQTMEKKPAQVQPLEAVAAAVRADLMRERQAEQAGQDAEALLAEVRQGKTLDQAAAGFNRALAETGFFKRNAAIPEIGFEQEVAAAAFELDAQNPLPENAIKGTGGVYVIGFKAQRMPAADGFEGEKADIESMLLQQKKSRVYSEWLAQIRSQSEITYEENYQE
ncbi:MAG: SurA N-terminal domain-containing protein [Desulfobacterales bacterium]